MLRSYVDSVVLRDVIERPAISNPTARIALQRHLLSNPAGNFSIKKTWRDFTSRGIAVGKDSVHAFLADLDDAFLVRTASMLTKSERQRSVNPRKAYPIDTWLIPLFATTGSEHVGHALETAIPLEREVRALVSARSVAPGSRALLITLDSAPPSLSLPTGVEWWPAACWLLDA